MQKISPFLWFDNQAEEAANFYVSIFEDSKITGVSHYGDAAAEVSGKPKGSVLTVTFEINGVQFVALNGGPQYNLTPAVSFAVNCDNQAEVDRLWEKLTAGGQEMPCGWLTDKYGVTWQVVPNGVDELLKGENGEAVAKELFKMKKIDIEVLRKAGG